MRVVCSMFLILIVPVSAQVTYSPTGWTDRVWPSTNTFRVNTNADLYAVSNIYVEKFVDVWTFTNTDGFIPHLIDVIDYTEFGPTNDVEYFRPYGSNVETNYIKATNTYYRGFRYLVEHATNTYSVSYTNNNLFGTPTVTMTVDRTVTPLTVTTNLNIAEMWALESILAVNERLDITGKTGTWMRIFRNMIDNSQMPYSPGDPAYNLRDTLVEVKNKIKSIYTNFTDKQTYTNYFTGKYQYDWIDTDYDGTNDTWSYAGDIVSDRIHTNVSWYVPPPYLSITTLVNDITDFPHSTNTVTHTNNVPGWFAGSNSVYTVTNYVYTRTNYTTKWFDYTPYRDLGGHSDDIDAVQTGSWTFAYYAPNYTGTTLVDIADSCSLSWTSKIVSNSASGVWELYIQNENETNTITTNWTRWLSATQTFTCTNTDMDVSFNSKEYGYKHVPSVLNLMIDTYENYAWADTNWLGLTNGKKTATSSAGAGTNSESWTWTKLDVETNYSAATAGNSLIPEKYSHGRTTITTTTNYTGWLYAEFDKAFTTNLSTNYSKTIEFYGAFDDYHPSQITSSNDTWVEDDYGDFSGYNYSGSNWFFFGETNVGTVDWGWIYAGDTSLVAPTNPWCAQPGAVTLEDSYRGYVQDFRVQTIIKWTDMLFTNTP